MTRQKESSTCTWHVLYFSLGISQRAKCFKRAKLQILKFFLDRQASSCTCFHGLLLQSFFSQGQSTKTLWIHACPSLSLREHHTSQNGCGYRVPLRISTKGSCMACWGSRQSRRSRINVCSVLLMFARWKFGNRFNKNLPLNAAPRSSASHLQANTAAAGKTRTEPVLATGCVVWWGFKQSTFNHIQSYSLQSIFNLIYLPASILVPARESPKHQNFFASWHCAGFKVASWHPQCRIEHTERSHPHTHTHYIYTHTYIHTHTYPHFSPTPTEPGRIQQILIANTSAEYLVAKHLTISSLAKHGSGPTVGCTALVKHLGRTALSCAKLC